MTTLEPMNPRVTAAQERKGHESVAATGSVVASPSRSLLRGLRDRQPGRSILRILWWYFLHHLTFLWFLFCYRYRAHGTSNIPARGGLIFVCNHQSFLDPIAVGLGGHRRQFYAMARSTLWRTKWLGWIIDSLNALPVERGEADLKAVRTCIEVLKRGHALLVFPEGTRTLDGTTQPFQTGMMLLIKRSGACVVPVAIEGAFEVWPKGRRWPRLWGCIRTRYGAPIEASTLTAMGAAEALEHLRGAVESMRRGLIQPPQAVG